MGGFSKIGVAIACSGLLTILATGIYWTPCIFTPRGAADEHFFSSSAECMRRIDGIDLPTAVMLISAVPVVLALVGLALAKGKRQSRVILIVVGVLVIFGPALDPGFFWEGSAPTDVRPGVGFFSGLVVLACGGAMVRAGRERPASSSLEGSERGSGIQPD